MRLRRSAVGLLIAIAATAAGAPSWHHPLYLGNGGLWRQRIRVTVRNDAPGAVAGRPVEVTVGTAAGQARLAGTPAEAIRVCTADGVELLFGLTAPDGAPVRRGPVPAGATLTIPAECDGDASTDCYVYFDNPSAWQPPDYLEGAAGIRNGGMEEGTGNAPAGWSHDPNDAAHETFWVTETPRSGAKCLKTVVADGAEPTWIATRQRDLHIVGGARYVMTAWVKAENVKGNAGWYIHVGNAANAMLISPMLNGGEGAYDWKQVRAEFTAPEDANLSDLGTVLRGTGTAWFDDAELVCLDEDELTAAVAAPEVLEVREVGADAPWLKTAAGDAYGDCRVPLRVVNLTDTAADDGLMSVDLSDTFARFQGRVREDSLRVVAAGQDIPFYRLRDILLFEGGAEPRTIRTYFLYFALAARPVAAAPAEGPREFAPNPALPGASEAEREQAGILIGDYEALLTGRRNLVRNASFEAAGDLPPEWPGAAEGNKPAGTVMAIDSPGLFGKQCARMSIPAESEKAWTGWRQDVPVAPGRSYLLAAWLKAEDIAPNVQLHAHFRDAAGELCKSRQHTGAGPALAGTQDWTMISGLFEMPEDIATFQVHLTMLATGTVWHDGVVVAEVSAGEAGRIEMRAADAVAGVAAWPVNAIVKVFREDVPPAPIPPARISCARNEKEPLQIAVRANERIPGLRVEVEPPVGPGGARLEGAEVRVVGYVPVDHKTNYYSTNSPPWHRKVPASPGACDGWAGWWPDPLLPRTTFDLEPGETQPVWVTVAAPGDAAPGDYAGAVRFVRPDGSVAARVPFGVRVWDFALPERTAFKAIYDCRGGEQWAVDGKTTKETMRDMWRFMAEYRLCPDTIRAPLSIRYEDGKAVADFTEFDEEARYYFDELNLPHAYTPWQFYLFGWGHLPGDKFGQAPYEGEYPYEGVDRSVLRPEFKEAYQACLKLFRDHVKEMGWADRIVLYISDEPYDGEEPIRAQMKALCAMIHEVDPEIRIYSSTWHHQPEWDGSLDVWGIGHYGIVPEEKIRELREGGATIWWTTDGQMCTDTPYCAIERLLPHYCFKYGADAYEFWGVDWLTYDPYEFGWHKFLPHDFGPGQDRTFVRYPNGDGFLAYPGGPIGHPGPVASVRLAQAREGVEDYEYLVLLRDRVRRTEEAGGDAAVGRAALARADALVAMPSAGGRYSTRILPDPDACLQVKEAVANAIEVLGK